MCGGGGIVKLALPILGGLAGGPLLGGVLGGGLLGSALGTGIGSTVGGLAAGQKPGKALLGGALSGLGSYAIGSLGAGANAAGQAGKAATNTATGLPAGSSGLAAGAAKGASTVGGGVPFGLDEIASANFLSDPGFLPDLTAAGGAATGAVPAGLDQIAAQNFLTDPGFAGTAGQLGLSVPPGTAAPTTPVTSEGLAPPSGSAAPLSPVTSQPLGDPRLSGEGLEDALGLTRGSVASQTAPQGTPIGPKAPATTVSPAGAAPLPQTDASWLDRALAGIGLDPTDSTVGKFISENPGFLLNVGGLGLSAMQQGPSKEDKELMRLAQTFRDQGADLRNYLQSGTLPPGAQQGLDTANESAKAAIRSKYARMGLSGSSMEIQELADVDRRTQDRAFQYARELLNTGLQESGLSAQLYQYLVGQQDKDDEALQQAIAKFATATAPAQPTQKAA